MQVLKPLVIFAVKELFLQREKKDIKKLVLERMAEDSKKLGLVLFIINLSAITFVLSIFSILFYTISETGQNTSKSALYSGAILLALSVLSIGLCFSFFRKKVAIYKDISEIKQSAKDFSWLSPLFNQLDLEHQKMKNKLQITNNK